MLLIKLESILLFCCAVFPYVLCAQTPQTGSKAQADVLILKDGEKVIGQVEHASNESVVFKSEALGEVTVKWTDIQELHSSQVFAAIPKDVKLRGKQDEAKVPKGTVSLTDQKIEVQTKAAPPPATIPVSNLGQLITQSNFEKAIERPGFFQGWKGGATGGLSLTEATQKNRSFTGAVNLVRAVPSEDWLEVRDRTIFDINEAYGKTSEPGTPSVKTSIFHLDLEQDRYLNPRLYAFGQAVLDHSFSQGLVLQQTYGGGLGFVVFKSDNSELDFRASLDYIRQEFTPPGVNQNLIGSIFGETYVQKFAHGILFNEQASITPAWNNTSAYSAFASAGLTFPVYHRFGLTLGALDNFLNNPPPGFKKNSFQFTAGATYAFQ